MRPDKLKSEWEFFTIVHKPSKVRRILFLLFWPVRAVLALIGLFFGACLCADKNIWEICKRDVRDLLKAWPQ